MKYARRVAELVFLFIALLSWAVVRSFGDGEGYGKPTTQIISDLTLSESRLLKDALLARIGLLLTYDPLVREIAQMRKWHRGKRSETRRRRAPCGWLRAAIDQSACKH